MRALTCLGLSMLVLAGCGKTEEEGCVLLAASFTENTTLPKGCYLAEQTPDLSAGVKLTLDPGVTIIFSAGTELEIADDQILSAVGTQALPILLTGAEKARGFWKGLSFTDTASTENRLEWVTVEYAGDTTSDSSAAAVKVASGDPNLSLVHTTIQESQGFGLYLEGSVTIPAFAANTLTKNTLGPASVDSNVAGLLDAASTYVGNDVDRVNVRAQYLQKNGNWAALDVPYYIDSNLRIEIPWTIAPGATLIMAPGSELDVEDDQNTQAIIALGTAEKPILITGEEKTRGSWTGITLGTGIAAGHQFDHVTVEYAGNISYTHDEDSAGIKVIADSRGVDLHLSNTTIQECAGWGLYLTGSARVPTFAGNTFTKNTLGPASIGSEAVWQLDVTSIYTGNDVDEVQVRGNYISKTCTWQDLGVPYTMEFHLDVNGNADSPVIWTIAPGAILQLPEEGKITVGGEYSQLYAVGTVEKPILITGITKQNGFWKAIVFDNTRAVASTISYATIEYGGFVGGSGETGMIQAQSDSRGVALSVTYSTIQHSGQWGIYWGGAASGDIATGNTFLDNAAGDVFLQTF